MKVINYTNIDEPFFEVEAGGIFVTFDDAKYDKSLTGEKMNIVLYYECLEVAIIREAKMAEFEKKFKGEIRGTK